MAFPADPLPLRAEMQIDGTWTEVTTRVRGAAPSNGVVITGGFAPEQTSIQPSTIGFTLNNRNGDFTDDNPNSPYYEKLPVNTPFRVSVEESTPFLRLPNGLDRDPTLDTAWTAGWVSTADKAVLDVTGDLDLRIEVEPDTWQLGAVGHDLAAKYAPTGNQRSWAWMVIPGGYMRLWWSTDGTSPIGGTTHATSTEPLPGTARLALRVDIDVNNGSGGWTVAFYTSDSITGTWTQLGDAVVGTGGATSIFSSTADLNVGNIADSTGTSVFITTDPPVLPLVGRIYRFQMRNGIGGTLVADMNATAQSEGATSWSDGLATANTWTTHGTAEVTVADYRGIGEISEMPQEWDPTGTDIYVPALASDISRRLTQGAVPLRSPIYRNLRQFIGAGALGYWTLEGGSQSTAAGNAISGQPAGEITNITFNGSDSTFPATAGTVTLNDANAVMTFRVVGAPSANQMFCIFYYKLSAAPASDSEIFNLITTGTCARVAFVTGATTYGVVAYDSTGAQIGSLFAAFGAGASPGQWLAIQIKLVKNGSGVDVDLAWFPLGTGGPFYGITLNIASATVGAPIRGFTGTGAATAGASFTHVMIGNLSGWEYATTAFAAASVGFRGEHAGVRWLRLLREEGEQGRIIGWPQDTEVMGPQPTDTLMNILDECANTAGALHYGARDQLALVFRTQHSMLAQNAIELDYTLKHLSGSFRPDNGDRLLKNNVTAQARFGGFATATKETGRKSIQPPPDGAGKYDGSAAVNPYTDSQLPDLASYAVHLGTWPERQVPNLEVWLERSVFTGNATLTRELRSANPGDRISVANVPAWVGGGTSDTLVRGYQETILNNSSARGHRLAFSTIPYGPFLAVNDLTGSDNTRRRAGATNTVLAVAVDSDDTTLVALTPLGKLWGTTAGKPGNFPLDVLLGGERVTVSGIGTWVADDFNRSASSSWGDSSTGSKTWSNSGGSASDYSVSGTAGRQNLSTVTTFRSSTLPLSARVSKVLFDRVQQISALTGGGSTATIIIKIGAANDYVSLNIQTTVGGTATHWLNQVVGGVETVFDSGFPSTGLSATAAMSVEIQITTVAGVSTAKARIYAQGTTPGGWTTSITMTQPNASGDVTALSARSSSSTNAAPFYIEYDGLTLPTLQAMTVSARSVNSIVKSQSIDTAIQVADAFYVARN